MADEEGQIKVYKENGKWNVLEPFTDRPSAICETHAHAMRFASRYARLMARSFDRKGF